MSTIARIVCLANSRKLQGRCVAGQIWDGSHFKKWICPVSHYSKGELSAERLYADGQDPRLLDIVELSLDSPRPVGCHVEDHFISSGQSWRKLGDAPFDQIAAGAEKAIGPLWINAGSTSEGTNDSIPEATASKLDSSLKLIRPRRLEMIATSEGAHFGKPRKRVRGHFDFGSYHYVFSVTDTIIEAEFASQSTGYSREIDEPLLCISISEVFDTQKACYKLIAGVIEE